MTAQRMKHGISSREFHNQLKRDPSLWRRLVIEIGTMEDADGGVLMLGNCRVCMSTIARKVQHG